jgi:ankyrin repeat domain-containing protein 50
MPGDLTKSKRLDADVRLAQAISEFEADLSSQQKQAFHAQRSQMLTSPPSLKDVMILTAQIDETSSSTRCFGPRMTNFLRAVQQFAALGDVAIGGSQNIIACGVWTLVRISLLVSV